MVVADTDAQDTFTVPEDGRRLTSKKMTNVHVPSFADKNQLLCHHKIKAVRNAVMD